jgi:tetratricopeptide (TPR) repeat protein
VAERFAEAERLAESGDPERALEVIEPLVRDEHAAVWARGWRAGLLETVGRPAEATLEMERLVTETGAPFFHQALGDRYLSAGLVEAAVTHLLAAVPVNALQDNPRLWSSLGIAWERLERHREAAWAYERLLREDKENGWVYGRLAYVSLRMGRPTRALELLEAALRLDPDTADHHKTRGLALWTLGRHQDARTALRRALELEADNQEVAAQLGALEAEVELPRF